MCVCVCGGVWWWCGVVCVCVCVRVCVWGISTSKTAQNGGSEASTLAVSDERGTVPHVTWGTATTNTRENEGDVADVGAGAGIPRTRTAYTHLIPHPARHRVVGERRDHAVVERPRVLRDCAAAEALVPADGERDVVHPRLDLRPEWVGPREAGTPSGCRAPISVRRARCAHFHRSHRTARAGQRGADPRAKRGAKERCRGSRN